ncbi:3',5'-cyclic AMP phosphodiesterase CpdA [Marisediminicola sp. UYEF4]|uniref:metallophosphoesterase family protein n=1 Tax=Marisediminicola sp. UYEF4 TaxID=1756384 RepID=UPI003396AE73
MSITLLSPPNFTPFNNEASSPIAGDTVPPIAGNPEARISVAGDTGTRTEAEHATARRMALEAQDDPYDALLLLGDLIYEDGEVALLGDAVTEPFSPIIDAGAELIPVLGNHDYRSNEQQQILAALGQDNPWYVEQIASVRLIVLDSNRVEDPAQTAWLRNTLAEPTPDRTWTLVAMHHPAYSAGHHGSDLAVRRAWSPLFAEFDVPLVLAGHDHDYQRSLPQDGVTYVVSGAGAKLRPTGREDFTKVSSSTLHYLDLLVYDERLIGRAITQSGTLIDTFTIER